MTPKKYDILLVDDEPEVTACLSDLLSCERVTCTCAQSGSAAVDLMRRRRFDVVLADMLMPGMDGLELLRRARQIHPHSQGILMSGRLTGGMAKSAIRHGAFDVIAKPFDLDHLRTVIAEACEGPLETAPSPSGDQIVGQSDLESCHPSCPWKTIPGGAAGQYCVGMVLELTASLEAQRPSTSQHSVNTAYYAEILGRELGLSPPELLVLKMASLVHDLGKLAIPNAVLDKPGKLTPEELVLVRCHPRIGYEVIRRSGCSGPVPAAVLFHHEWWNGGGYPHGLRGKEIPLAARIIHLADAVDAMFSRRSYRPRYTRDRVVHELATCCGGQFDPRIARVAIHWLDRNPQGVLAAENRTGLLAELGYQPVCDPQVVSYPAEGAVPGPW